MINNSLEFKLKKNRFSKKISKNFSKIFLNSKKELLDKKKTLNILNKKFVLNFKLSELKNFRKFKTIALIGMGGSILGAEAIHNFLKKKIKKKVYFFDDINENKISTFKKNKKLDKVLFIIISKSGNTIETLSNTFSLNIIKKNAKNIILISEKKNNFLYNLSKKFNLFHIPHNTSIGGRYSVLSEVGIVPAYLMGLNIYKLRTNLLEYFQNTKKNIIKESVIKLSSCLRLRKYNNLIFLNYSPQLEKFLFWLQQLIAESLGKKNKGFLPVVSNVPKDHHSLLQLYLDGPKDKIFYIFSTNEVSKIKLNIFKNLQKDNFLNKKTLNLVKEAQKRALTKVLQKNNMPYREIKIEKKDEQTLGKLFSYFIIETIMIGKLSKINPYDQPAVEQVKIYTKKILN